MKKRAFSLLLALLMTSSAILTSCGNENPKETEPVETSAVETNAPETTAPETNVTETNAPETNAPETNAPETTAPETEPAPETPFPVDKLTMLGSKSTCKDRWRQVLAEADRIDHKHLLTLEAAISTHQTDEMKDKKLQLVIPEAIHKTYTAAQQSWLWDVKSLLAMLLEKQASL